MSKTMEYHEAANIFPLDEVHVGELAEDIKARGLLKPVELLGGKIIDGRRRWLACKKAKIEPETCEIKTSDPVAYVVSLNLKRRHLTPSQCAMVATKMRDYYDKQAKERQVVRKGKQPGAKVKKSSQLSAGKSRDQLGKTLGISGFTVDQARRVARNGIPEIAVAVEQGNLTVNRAEGIAQLPQDKQAAALKEALASPHTLTEKEKGAAPSPVRVKGLGSVLGKGVVYAQEAINCLRKIPKNDPLRKQAFQIVKDWIKQNP